MQIERLSQWLQFEHATERFKLEAHMLMLTWNRIQSHICQFHTRANQATNLVLLSPLPCLPVVDFSPTAPEARKPFTLSRSHPRDTADTLPINATHVAESQVLHLAIESQPKRNSWPRSDECRCRANFQTLREWVNARFKLRQKNGKLKFASDRKNLFPEIRD